MIGVPTVPLFPVPRSFELLDEPGPAPGAPLAVHHDPDLPEQGYSLVRDASGTRIGYRDDAGLRYARQTLDQLRADRELSGRAVRVRDWPDFAVRGFMLDVSRDRVPTRRTLRRYVEILAAVRMNQLELYTEHTFAYADHAVVWAAASPLTPDDMRWLDALCAAHGITLVANQNTLGHMERWLAHEPYRDRAERPDGFAIGARHRAPSTLQPTPENAAFAVGLVRELAATVRARRVNIGADEPWELGKGRSAADAAERGLGQVYLDHLLRVATPLIEDGFEVPFWADVLADHPEVAGALPASGLIPVVWQYDGPGHARAALDRASDTACAVSRTATSPSAPAGRVSVSVSTAVDSTSWAAASASGTTAGTASASPPASSRVNSAEALRMGASRRSATVPMAASTVPRPGASSAKTTRSSVAPRSMSRLLSRHQLTAAPNSSPG